MTTDQTNDLEKETLDRSNPVKVYLTPSEKEALKVKLKEGAKASPYFRSLFLRELSPAPTGKHERIRKLSFRVLGHSA